MRTTGTVSRGIRAPIIKQGDDLVLIVAESVMNAAKEERFELRDRDVVGVTESLLARAQGNYATMEQIAADVRAKFPSGIIGVILPILSRNRFPQLPAIAQAADEIYLQLSYPNDEVGNPLISTELLEKKGVNPYTDTFTEEEFVELFGKPLHPFTGVNYIDYYKQITGGKTKIIIANNPREILKYTKNVICADIHTRFRSKKLLLEAGAEKVYSMDEILNAPVNGSGYHPEYGLLGCNLATNNSLKLFPRDAQSFAEKLSARLSELSGRNIEVLVYGDGAFKDPVGGIWELADPVVSPGFTKGLEGTPNEVKIKYFADNVTDEEGAIKDLIRHKKSDLRGDMAAQGTTPRRFSDLLGSLCDLTSGSGDKGTPIVLVQGYFDSYAD
jgi:F420-0:gamma-glutamyl ligase